MIAQMVFDNDQYRFPTKLFYVSNDDEFHEHEGITRRLNGREPLVWTLAPGPRTGKEAATEKSRDLGN